MSENQIDKSAVQVAVDTLTDLCGKSRPNVVRLQAAQTLISYGVDPKEPGLPAPTPKSPPQTGTDAVEAAKDKVKKKGKK